MKTEMTMNHAASIETNNASSPASQSMVDKDIANLSGGIFDATPFVEKPLDVFFPQSRKTRRKATLRTTSSLRERPVDEEMIHLTGGLFDIAPSDDDTVRDSFVPSRNSLYAVTATHFDSFYPAAMDVRTDSVRPQMMDVAPASVAAQRHGFGEKVVRAAAVVAFGAAGVLAALLFQRSEPASANAPVVSAAAAIAAPRVESAPVVQAAEVAKPKAKPAVAKAARGQAKSPLAAEQPSVSAAAAPIATPVAAEAQLPGEAPASKESLPAPQAAAEPSAPESALENAPVQGASESVEMPKPLVSIDLTRAASAIAAASQGAAACLEPGEGSRSMQVSVRFAPSGNATRALIENGPLRGTPAASCIAQHLRSATVNAFEGEAVTVRTNITVR